MKILFFGSSAFSVPFLEAISDSLHKVELVVTSTDKRCGRGRKLKPNCVKSFSIKKDIPFLEIDNFDSNFYKRISETNYDFLVVVSFGKILPSRFIDNAKGNTVNVHPSILPKYRGPSPIITALLNGDALTGISLIKIEKEFDTGDIYMMTKFAVSESDNRATLEDKIAELGSKMLLSLLNLLEKHDLYTFPQEKEDISYTRIFTKKDTLIKWCDDPFKIHNLIRAFGPDPGSITTYKDRIIKILTAGLTGPVPEIVQNKYLPGQIVKADSSGLIVKCGNAVSSGTRKKELFISIKTLKPEGKNIMDYKDFINGYKISSGDIFE